MNKITVIGTGSVGSTIAYTATLSGLASEIVLIDINGEKAIGEAMDIRQGTPFAKSIRLEESSHKTNLGLHSPNNATHRVPGESHRPSCILPEFPSLAP